MITKTMITIRKNLKGLGFEETFWQTADTVLEMLS